MDDGGARQASRPVVALCTCGRSQILPWCDTSHRNRPASDRDG
ncbi:CDGSH iron-sulfur domain-containing protein, partial [Streptomyces sp. NPDC000405]